MNEKDDKIDELEDKVDDLQEQIQKKNEELKDLDNKYETTLKKNLHETTHCSQLQETIAQLENQLKEVHSKYEKTISTTKPNKATDAESPTLYDLLDTNKQRTDALKADLIDLEKNYANVFIYVSSIIWFRYVRRSWPLKKNTRR